MFSKKAFTLVEIIVALTVIGVIAAITLTSGISMEKIRLAKTKALSNSFYALINAAYPDILKNNAISELTSENLRDLFLPYLDAREATDDEVNNLKNLIGTNYSASTYKNSFSCLRTSQKITACFYINNACNASNVKLFFTCSDDTTEHKAYKKVCGSIYYVTPDSKGTVYEDIFRIPLGKSGVKG